MFSTNPNPSYADFEASLERLDGLRIGLEKNSLLDPVTPSGTWRPRLRYGPGRETLANAIKEYIRVAQHYIPNEDVWEELRARKRGGRETTFARAVVVSIEVFTEQVEDDQVTNEGNVERYKESLVRLLKEGIPHRAHSSSPPAEHHSAETLASLGTTSRRYARHARLPLVGLGEGNGSRWARAERPNPFVPMSRA